MILKLTHEDAQEVGHKIGVLADTPDLQEDYGLTQAQANELCQSVPRIGEWIVPEWAIAAVRGEIEDHIEILRDIAKDARGIDMGQALRIAKQATRLERMLE